jgi:hypothetical protein
MDGLLRRAGIGATCALEKIWRRSSSKEIILKQPLA